MQPIQRRAPTAQRDATARRQGRRRCFAACGFMASDSSTVLPCSISRALPAHAMGLRRPGDDEQQRNEDAHQRSGLYRRRKSVAALHGLVSLLEHPVLLNRRRHLLKPRRTRLGVVGDLHHVDTETRADDMPTLARPQRQHAWVNRSPNRLKSWGWI